LTKLIKDNNKNGSMKNKAFEIIKNNYNKLLLINIYIDENKNNILIFVEEEKSWIIQTKEEIKLFKKLYYEIKNNIYSHNIDKICEKYKEELIKKKLFKQEITNLDDYENINIYFSFIGQVLISFWKMI